MVLATFVALAGSPDDEPRSWNSMDRDLTAGLPGQMLGASLQHRGEEILRRVDDSESTRMPGHLEAAGR